MFTLPILDDLPVGYFVDESPGGVLALHIDVARDFYDAGFGPEQDGSLRESDLAGRVPMRQLEVGGECFVVRRYRHGGVFRWLNRWRYFDPERPFRELIVSNALARSGVLTPQVVAARARYAVGGGWYLELVTRRVERSRDLAEVLEQMRRGELEDAERRAVLRAAGELVRAMHDLGLRHADLTPRNILLQDPPGGEPAAAPGLWVLDLDGSYFTEKLEATARRHNLRRLLRSVLRRESRGHPFLTRTDFLRFLAGYETGSEERKREWRTVRELHRRTHGLHAAGWFVEQALGGGPEKRDGKAVVR